jgi:hypothetical protein
MTVHVSVRSISPLLLLSLWGLPADALAQPVVASQKTAPTLAERLDRLAAEFERNRIDLHVPGAVLAIVRGEEVISPAALTTTWTPQIQVGGGAGYGMGWVVRTWQGQRLIFQVERVEVDVELPPDTFTLEPSTSPGSGK